MLLAHASAETRGAEILSLHSVTRGQRIQGGGCATRIGIGPVPRRKRDYENDRELPIVLEKGRCGLDVLRIIKSSTAGRSPLAGYADVRTVHGTSATSSLLRAI